ncbi:DExH-box ATP-dependent RNA helicase DExH3 isoform X1 [Iris pallida]|uniref:DExH-box ATP-dependent RNA helicase DExH3 isoform X1 n=1 Tax=Iris pallida TaxID=29817 RepID=A0AAX6I9X6_IRIPA|nr:DExH-box ATP-dependent RNA helicase DExH3 isoform X1 [Iris pallida]KAJ6849564.1 DExH-box ATP-dependent RNA helicase DExH3 isoform X1 [Iris pallida]
MNEDFLLVVLKELLTRRRDLRLILMIIQTFTGYGNQYFIEEVVNLFDGSDLHKSWIKYLEKYLEDFKKKKSTYYRRRHSPSMISSELCIDFSGALIYKENL